MQKLNHYHLSWNLTEMKTNDTYIKRSCICPICEKFEFTQKYFDKNNIRQDDNFNCPVCGGEIVYSILYRMNVNGSGEEYIAVYADDELM